MSEAEAEAAAVTMALAVVMAKNMVLMVIPNLRDFPSLQLLQLVKRIITKLHA